MSCISKNGTGMNTEMKSPEARRRALNASGMRFTNQRASILEIIRRGEGHLDADEVYRQAREKQPNLSLSTVYRTLRMFKELGLVKEVHFDESHHRYEVKAAHEHHHLICLGCGKVIEFQYLLARYVKRNVAEAKDFDIVDTEIRMRGYCSECRQGME